MKIPLFLLSVLMLLIGCGGNKPDIHSMPRETKAYETASIEKMDRTALILHLETLSDEMSLATENGTYAEMHHIEIALTKALALLESKAPASARSTLDTIKVVAAKIHGAGHDQNKSMATKLDATLRDQIGKLKAILDTESIMPLPDQDFNRIRMH